MKKIKKVNKSKRKKYQTKETERRKTKIYIYINNNNKQFYGKSKKNLLENLTPQPSDSQEEF